MLFDFPAIAVPIVLLLVRVVVAIAFVRESLLKLKDIPAFAKNDSVPVWLAWIVAIAELAAAVSFATGVLAQIAALGVILLMLITTGLHVFVWHSKYWAQKGGPEYDVLLIVFAAVIAVFGPGLFSIPLWF